MKKVKAGDSPGRSPSSVDQAGQPSNKQKILASKDKLERGSNKAQTNNVTGNLKELEKRVADDLPIDAKRINDMKSAIANGEYQVNAESIANKMIDFESSLKKK